MLTGLTPVTKINSAVLTCERISAGGGGRRRRRRRKQNANESEHLVSLDARRIAM